jgi:hypothetical protein
MVRRSGPAGALATVILLLVGIPAPTFGASKSLDLDGNAANGAESRCDLNVITTFPVKVENVVTNKSVGNAYDFSWPSAGPGGFTSSAAAGTAGGVGAKWTWTTNQSVFSYVGSTCPRDLCFLKTAGPDPLASTCERGCVEDGVSMTVGKGAAGEVALNWSGGDPTYSVYRSTAANAITAPSSLLTQTSGLSLTDVPPAGGIVFYRVRAATCLQLKACGSNADCVPASEGSCVTVGPFQVPGRSLTTTDVTVSSASLTSSLITFFSPPTVVFQVSSTTQPGGIQEVRTNGSTAPVTVTNEAYPPGCCPANPDVPQQLRCGEECVDYLNDPMNCGACGNVCGEGTCCSNGNCTSLCAEGQTWCNGRCVDFRNDSENCGACGNVCGEATCCFEGGCASFCEEGATWCGDGLCAELQDDSGNCGACGNVCDEGSCCNGGTCESLCAEGQSWCDGQCADYQNDSNNCGACGNVCGGGTCCFEGQCASVCPAGQTWCNGQCVDLRNDSLNCGACGNVCGDGTCCFEGQCASVCPAGQTWCNGQCADLQNDSLNCGACGNACGEGACCNGGTCQSTCEAGRTYCDGLCYDLQNDPMNCGACGNVCAEDSICTGGACVPCTGQGGRKDACDNRCVNTNTDPYNCGGCGISCNLDCPSGFTGVCSNGESCRCVEGTPAPPPPPNTPQPTEPVCPNPNPTSPGAGMCPNPNPTSPGAGMCPNPNPSSGPVPGVCANPNPSPGPEYGFCPNPDPTHPVPGYCPSPGPPAPDVEPTPNCLVEAATETIPPGGTSTICRPGGLLFREVATQVSVCGDTIPGPDGECADGISNVSTGTFMRFVPDTETVIGEAFVTPFAVHVTADDSMDGLIQPGENATVFIEVVNAGPVAIADAQATLLASPVDLTDDGVNNPLAMAIISGSSSYGTIAGTQPSQNCEPVTLHPATNQVAFRITAPAEFPGDTSTPFTLRFTGTVNGNPFTQDMPIALGIADRCVYALATGDYDGVDGLQNPMERLVPDGDAVIFPSKPFNAGQTRPLKVRLLCGGVELMGGQVDAPQIVGLSEATRGPLDIGSLNLNDDGPNPNDPFFRWSATSVRWIFNMRTSEIGTGRFTIKIRIAGRKDYVAGFELR